VTRRPLDVEDFGTVCGSEVVLDGPVWQRNYHYVATGQRNKTAGRDSEAEEKLRGWLNSRVPGDWFTGAADVTLDREEITVVGPLADPETRAQATEVERSEAVEGRIRRFREDTRDHRIRIAREAEHKFGRQVSWGVTCGGRTVMFTTLSVPVMTRLRQPQRLVLDTLVDAGVARSRSEALAWCVKLVGEHEDSWLVDLREALRRVQQVRSEGPAAREV
jgi:hypothetical protein